MGRTPRFTPGLAVMLLCHSLVRRALAWVEGKRGKSVRQRMQTLLAEIDYDFSAFSPQGFARWLERRRGRPIELIPWRIRSAASGAWLADEERDYVFYESEAPLFYQEHVQLHEMAHMLCGHSTATVCFRRRQPSCQIKAQLALTPLPRSHRFDESELEAETLADLIQEQILRHAAVQKRATVTFLSEPGSSASLLRPLVSLANRVAGIPAIGAGALALARAVIRCQKILALRELNTLKSRLDWITRPLLPDHSWPVAWLGRLRKPDLHIHRMVVAILDRKKALDAHLKQRPEEAMTKGRLLEEAIRLQQMLRAVAESPGFGDLVDRYRTLGRQLECGAAQGERWHL
jgi:hypothetical protein